MKYFLDTNICIYFLKGMDNALKHRLLSEDPDNIKIPSIVKAELLYGAEKSERRTDNINKINQFLSPLDIIAFNDNACGEYAKIRADLEKRGNIIGPNDLLIASTVKSNNGTLITNNVKEFCRVKDLQIDNWCK